MSVAVTTQQLLLREQQVNSLNRQRLQTLIATTSTTLCDSSVDVAPVSEPVTSRVTM
jgi:hypothetical protein